MLARRMVAAVEDQSVTHSTDRDPATPLKIFIIAGEHSGDQLGARLMPELRRQHGREIAFAGLGDHAMQAQGIDPVFPMADVAVMGPVAIAKRLPSLVRRVYQLVDAVLAFRPDVLVLIDSPELTHAVASRVRARAPDIPIIDYVSPTVWAWRSGRARKMRAYVDHVLALLPFEPAAHARLGGPVCTYVGHPLVERQAWLEAQDPERLRARLGLAPGAEFIVVLPGSRPNEVNRLMAPFGEALARLKAQGLDRPVVIPVVESVRPLIEQALTSWPLQPHLISDEGEKFASFRGARAALAASGTVTLELAFAGCPMVVGYRLDALAARLKFLVNVPSIVLANLVAEQNVFPEFIHETCTGLHLAEALAPLIAGGPARDAQLAGLALVADKLRPPMATPSEAAAAIILRYAMVRRPAR